MKTVLARVHTGLAYVLVLGSVLQFFLISMSVFGPVSREIHSNGGRILSAVALLTLIVALIIRTSKRTTWTSVAVFLLLFPVQGILAFMDLPYFLKSLHAVTGVGILYLSYALAHGWAKAAVPEETVSSRRAATAD